MESVLYVNHRKQQCGVYEFGRDIANVIAGSKKYNFYYCECDSFNELKSFYDKIRPRVIIYNYTNTTMPWLDRVNKYDVPITYKINAIHIGTIHDVYQRAADNATDFMFDFHVAPDPTLLLKNSIVYKTSRLLPRKPKVVDKNFDIPIIGSFGFATFGKGFDKIIKLVQQDFDKATIRLNIPFAKFGDENGENAKRIAELCKSLIFKDSIKLEIDHSYLSKNDLLDFLSENSINVFLYDDMDERGISSAADWALASGRPVAISKSRLFRHLFQCRPSICIGENSLTEIINNGILPLKKIWDEWTEENFVWQYEEIVSRSLNRESKSSEGIRNRFNYYRDKILIRTGLKKSHGINLNQWTKSGDEYIENNFSYKEYQPISLPPDACLNRILDNEARLLYKPAINFLEDNFPYLISKKISEANVQQAFVMDTAVRLANSISSPVKMLAVGAFEDTAVEALKMLKYDIDEIDPIFNYDLHTFTSKPNVKAGNNYDIIISTSVIEHVLDDEEFIKDISFLLKPGGYAIITCDYKDQYQPGDDIPDVDFRFYTQRDLKKRLMGKIPECFLLDSAQWDCEKPDFFFLGKYNYTFASLVFKKG
jgi:SAM-dependent methyltransferase